MQGKLAYFDVITRTAIPAGTCEARVLRDKSHLSSNSSGVQFGNSNHDHQNTEQNTTNVGSTRHSKLMLYESAGVVVNRISKFD